MINLGKNLVWGVGLPIALTLATSGCASKKYVSQQIAPVNQRITKVEQTTNEKIAFLNAKQERDVSQLNERISTTDARVAQVASAAEQAQGTASRAMQETQASSEKLSAAINTLGSGVANALNYQLVEKADVTFAFNKATLTPEAKMALDQIASKMQSMPRSVVELTGFTDRVGGANYNLALSRRRAEAVQRYLVSQKVPPRCIHIVGMGKEPPPPDLEADLSAIDPNASNADKQRLARRVSIRVFGAGDISEGTASRIQQ
jgi:outer membrane protein OmpA-like peptidoglycan-associated protein